MEYNNPFNTDGSRPELTDPNNPSGNYPPAPSAPPAAPSNPFNPQTRDRVVRGWTSSSYNPNRQGIEQYLQSLGADGQGWRVDRDDKVYDPSGRVYDWIGNVNTANAQKRTGYTTDSRYSHITGSKGGKNASKAKKTGAPMAPAAPASPSANAYAEDPRGKALYEELLKRSQQGLAIDRNDPIIRGQADAYSANQERSRRNYLGDLAEKSGPNANLRGEQRLTAERAGQASGAFESELMGRELTARRDEIAQALNSRQNYLSDQQRNSLTMELAKMDDAVRRLGISTQDKQFNQDLGYRNRALDQGNSQFYAGLNQSDNQFRDRLGFDYADRSNYWDAYNRGL
jgi:hypothetical protein